MLIHNTTTGVKVEADMNDVDMNIDNMSIQINMGGGYINIARYKDGDSLMKAYTHLMQAFMVAKNDNLNNLTYQITDCL